MENISELKRKILELTRDYSKKAHSAFRPGRDDLRLHWEEGMPIPYAGRVFTEDEYSEHKSNPPAKASDLSEIEGLKTTTGE